MKLICKYRVRKTSGLSNKLWLFSRPMCCYYYQGSKVNTAWEFSSFTRGTLLCFSHKKIS